MILLSVCVCYRYTSTPDLYVLTNSFPPRPSSDLVKLRLIFRQYIFGAIIARFDDIADLRIDRPRRFVRHVHVLAARIAQEHLFFAFAILQRAKLVGHAPARHHVPSELGGILDRSEERRVGKECVSTCRSRWSPEH